MLSPDEQKQVVQALRDLEHTKRLLKTLLCGNSVSVSVSVSSVTDSADTALRASTWSVEIKL